MSILLEKTEKIKKILKKFQKLKFFVALMSLNDR